jgi:transcriptional regulator NrdR family protein
MTNSRSHKVAIMQPYFLPYIGYFQLINAVDLFVLYDNIEYIKGSWINRNRICVEGHAKYITIPLERASDYSAVCTRSIANSFNRTKMISQISAAYKKAPHYKTIMPSVEKIILFESQSLFDYIHHSIIQMNNILEIDTEIVVSSTMPIDHSLKAEKKVIALCKELKAEEYYNPIGGMRLYDTAEFQNNGLVLKFLKSEIKPYEQSGKCFIPSLSIIDIMMNNSKDHIREMMGSYTLQ